MTLLQIRNLSVVYHNGSRTVTAVNGVTLDVEEQDSVGIVGESGSGKSTLAMALLRLLPGRTAKVEGEVLFGGQPLLELGERELSCLRWKELAVVFQKSMNSLSPVHRIGTQMADVYRLHEHETRLSKKQVRERIIKLLESVRLPARVYDLYPHELSGGMMQRVSIALGLMHRPRLLILDEATTALDVVTQGQILREMMELEQELRLARIMITHDMSVVAAACKKVAVMYAGHLVEFGPVQDVLRHPLHPYTQGLLRSLPSFKGAKDHIRGIPGSLPDLSSPLQGCVFADRCEHAMPICRQAQPVDTAYSGSRRVACHLIGGEAHAAQ
ncbi:ABC transporter ATP-binding protein [Paenibacillus sp. P96]|uniref:ABC transporter ATP-binding protein n=1 Tax=Paenibacillus zeirhizosphaerae TaxID=2987519 RepID=A0ABT9FKK8_9BACL|nr:ABC transporter ATP-binding protein [Paenibacillus sp. P96]MDP4095268.1 ABC transporter ATP-binding protein [Paenibacillus sp. P96]